MSGRAAVFLAYSTFLLARRLNPVRSLDNSGLDRQLILLVSMLAGANAFSTEVVDCGTAKPDDIAGVWRLLEASTTLADGTVQYPYGQPAAGLFIYTPGGHASQIERGPWEAGRAPGRVEPHVDVVRLGRAPQRNVPMIVQVSRWDRLPNRLGVMLGFVQMLEKMMR